MTRCETCRFYASLARECRRNPPLAVPVQVNGQLQTLGIFPATKPESWCGAYEDTGPEVAH